MSFMHHLLRITGQILAKIFRRINYENAMF